MAENENATVQNTNTTDATSKENTNPSEGAAPALADQTKQGEGTKTTETNNNPTPAEKPPEQKTVVPEKYELKLPEGSQIDASRLESISQFAKEKGFSNEQAQALVDREHDAVTAYKENLVALQQQNADKWMEQSKADKEIGGQNFNENAEMAKRVVNKFGSEQLKKELNETGFGNHPELVRLFSRIGKSMAEDKLIVTNSTAGPTKSVEERFYGPQK